MPRRQTILQILIAIASIPFLYFIFSHAEYNWLYHASLSVIIVCSTISLIDHWRSGNTQRVRSALLQYTLILITCIALALIFK